MEPSPIDQDADEDAQRFEQLVDEALSDVPDEFRPYMENLVVRVEDEPSAETLQQAGVGPGSTLLGLYTGVPLTAQGIAGAGPEVISIYRRPIERYCGGDPNRIRAQVLATVLHELAHHFGIDHDDMPEWVK
jgi:predicted Zn-dependent protease with MMP-like domain